MVRGKWTPNIMHIWDCLTPNLLKWSLICLSLLSSGYMLLKDSGNWLQEFAPIQPQKHEMMLACYTCTQSPRLPMMTVCSDVALSSGGQIKHTLWWELLLQLQNTPFRVRHFSTRPTTPSYWDRLRHSFKRPCQTHQGQVSVIHPVRP